MAEKNNVNSNNNDNKKNNYDFMLERIQEEPYLICHIGDKLLKQELAKGKNEDGSYKSELLRIPIERGKLLILDFSCETLKNNYELVSEYLKQSYVLGKKVTIDIIGEELLKQELAKGKNKDGSYKSELIKFTIENDKINITPQSSNFLRNNDEMVKLNMKFHPGDIGVIGEELYQRELAKGRNSDGSFKSEIFNDAIMSGKFEIYQDSIDSLKNNEELIKIHLEAHPLKISAIGEELLNKELKKGKNSEGEYISEILKKIDEAEEVYIRSNSPEYLKNNYEIILMYLKKYSKNSFASANIGAIGEELFNKELKKGKDSNGNYKSEILNELFYKKLKIDEFSPTYIRNNLQFMQDCVLKNTQCIEGIGEELFYSELAKGKDDNGQYNSLILNLLVERDDWSLTSLWPDFLKNNLEIVLVFLKKDPKDIDNIGEELLKSELAKGKDESGHYKSELFSQLLNNSNWNLSKASPDVLKNNKELIEMQIYRNPQTIEILDEEMLDKEIAKGKDENGDYNSNILNVIIKSKSLKITYYSPEYIKNNEELIYLYLQQNPGEVAVIGEKLLKEETRKGKDERGHYKSRILSTIQENKTIKLYSLPKHIINNEEIVQMYLDFNKSDKIVVGDELLIKELEKGKEDNGEYKSEILQKIVKSKRYKIESSNDFAKNNEELFLIHLQSNPGEIDCIGELLLKQEIEKGKNEKGEYNSKILAELVRSKKCNIRYSDNKFIRNNEDIIKIFLDSDEKEITLSVLGRELLKKELDKGKNETGFNSEILNRIINNEHFRITGGEDKDLINDEKIFLAHLKANPGDIEPIGESLFKNEIQKGRNRDGSFKSEILELFRKHPKGYIYKSSKNRFLFNNADIMLILVQQNSYIINYIEEELFQKELSKGMIDDETFRSEILQTVYESNSMSIFKDSCISLRTNERFILKCLGQQNANLEFLDENFLNSELEKKISVNRKKEYEFESPIVKLIAYHMINNLSNQTPILLRNNPILMKIAIEHNVQNFGNIGKSLYDNVVSKNKSWMDYIRQNYVIDRYAQSFIKNNPELVIPSLKNSINSFDFIGDELLTKELTKEDSEIINFLLSSNYEITEQTPDRIKSFEFICDLSLKNNINSLNLISENVFRKKMKDKDNFLSELKERGFYLTDKSKEHINSDMDLIQISLDNNISSFCNINIRILESEYEKLELKGTSELFEKLADKIPNVKREDIFSIIKELHTYNEDVLSTLNMELLQNKYLGIRDKLNIIAPYPDIQSKITSLNEHQYILFERILDEVSKDSNDYRDIIGNVLDGLTDSEKGFEKLNIQFNENINNLTREQINTLIYLYTSKNYFNIEALDQIDKYLDIKSKICDELIMNPGTDTITNFKEIQTLENQLDRMKFALLQKAYGIGLDEANIFINNYGKAFDGYEGTLTKEESIIFKQILIIKGILEINNPDNIKQAYNQLERENVESYLSKSLQTKVIRNFITKRYNEKLFKTEDIDTIDIVKYEDKEIKVYSAGTDFSMLIHAVGAYSEFEIPDNYKEYWNMPKTATHGFCTSYIGNNMLGVARTKSVIYGFNNLQEGEFVVSAPWDIVSRVGNSEFNSIDIMEKSGNVSIRLPESQKNDTRHTHNETVLERNIIVDDKLIKKQPDYLVYIVDKFDSVDELKDESWVETKKAASQFGIPIVIIDRSLCAEKERKKIEDNLKQAKKTNDISLLIDSMLEVQSNIAGCRKYYENIRNKYFDETFVKSILDSMIHIIEETRKVSTYDAKKAIEQVFLYEKQELNRWIHTRLKDKKFTGYNHEEFLIKLQEQMAYIRKIEKENKPQNKQKTELYDMLSDSRMKDECALIYDYIEKEKYHSQEKIKEIPLDKIIQLFRELNIEEQIQDIKSTNLYDERKAHSLRHIQDVTLFGAIIGKLEGLNNNELTLLIEACKYHDSGRLDDSNTNHAEAGQRIAKIMLENQYNEEEIGIIRAAIEFHESTSDDVSLFKSIAEKFEVKDIEKAYKIARILKDADALDRCRFVNKARLDVRKLRTETSKKLIPLSCRINELYAKKDLERMSENYNEIQKKQIEDRIREYGILETVKSLNKGTFVLQEGKTAFSISDYKEIFSNQPNIEFWGWEKYILSQIESENKKTDYENEIS